MLDAIISAAAEAIFSYILDTLEPAESHVIRPTDGDADRAACRGRPTLNRISGREIRV